MLQTGRKRKTTFGPAPIDACRPDSDHPRRPGKAWPGQACQVWAFNNRAGERAGEHTWEGKALHWPYRVALQLLGVPLESALPDVLETLGRLGGADRVYVIEYNEALTRFRNTHEWTRPGVRGYVEDLQNAPVALLGGLHREMLAAHALAVTDVAQMPRDMRALQAEFRRQGNRGVLCLPLYFEGRLRGLFGFDVTRARQVWSAAVVTAMFRCAELLALALHGRAAGAASAMPPPVRFPALIYLRNGSSLHGVPLASVVAVRAQRNTSVVQLDDGSTQADRRPIMQWQALLPATRFTRVHRGTIVRVKAIRELVRDKNGCWHVALYGLAEPLNVSREAVAALRARLEAPVQ